MVLGTALLTGLALGLRFGLAPLRFRYPTPFVTICPVIFAVCIAYWAYRSHGFTRIANEKLSFVDWIVFATSIFMFFAVAAIIETETRIAESRKAWIASLKQPFHFILVLWPVAVAVTAILDGYGVSHPNFVPAYADAVVLDAHH